MKNIHKYIMLFVMAFAVASCADDEIIENNNSGKPGGDVRFGLSLDNGSRTVYGPEANNAFPIYWSEGDKVQIFSPQCASGRNNAEYSVKPVSGQSYAEELTKTGDYGVQWGEGYSEDVNGEKVEGLHDFYSVYPSLNAAFSGSGNSVKASLNVSSEQVAELIREVDDANIGTFVSADMDNVVMYAQTKTNKVAAGGVVNLKYNPYSTVLEFELNATLSEDASIFIDNITLVANTGIAGAFTLTFNGDGVPTIATVTDNNPQSITMSFNVTPELTAETPNLKARMCLMPIDGINSLEGWKVIVNGREGDGTTLSKSKTLTATGALAPGKVHKIKLPSLASTKKWEYIPGNWMPQLPDYQTIYLTELSIPGAWYAGQKTSDGYQNTTSFDDFWSNGVRAFGLECRAASPKSWGVVPDNQSPTRIALSGTGSENNGAYASQTLTGKITYISSIIESIANKVKGTNEFAVVVLNYAFGSTGGYRPLDYQNFLKLISNEITQSGAKNVVSNITPNTTIGDVLGQLIVKVNVDGRVNFTVGDENNKINALFSATPLFSELTAGNIYYSGIYSGLWNSTNHYVYKSNYNEVTSDFIWCFTNANRTQPDTGNDADLPKYKDRKKSLNSMVNYSRKIYDSSDHNVWFYFNAGGTQSDNIEDGGNPSAFAKEMNPWLYNLILRKTNGGYDDDGTLHSSDPSSLGIVMFNKTTVDEVTENKENVNYYGKSIVRAIIEMNNKFKLKHASKSKQADYSSSYNNGGNAFSLD